MHLLSSIFPLSVILLVLSLSYAHAHESPSHSLTQLNKHIAENPTPALYFQRAMAYKELGKSGLAAADLTTATKAQPTRLPWQIERCRVELTANHPDTALIIANQSLKLAKDREQRAEIHFLRAQAYQQSGKPKPSLHACQLAFNEIPAGKIEWFLLRSENQRLLELHEQRLLGLNAGLKSHPESILKPHYVDALIDAGKHSEALTLIEKELSTLRWKSHWQVKEARALIGLNRNPEAQKTLTAALQEIQGRLNPSRPDILLLADQAQAHHLMGNTAATTATLQQLKKHQAPAWLTSRLETQNAKSPTSKPK